jgi:hypothetical protein
MAEYWVGLPGDIGTDHTGGFTHLAQLRLGTPAEGGGVEWGATERTWVCVTADDDSRAREIVADILGVMPSGLTVGDFPAELNR